MKRTVFECRSCDEPCRLVMLGEKSLYQSICPVAGVSYAVWQEVSECEVPEAEEEESKEEQK